MNYLKEHWHVQDTTASQYLHSFIITAKFIHVEQSRGNFEQVESIAHLRSLRNQLEKTQLFTKSAPSAKLLWPQFQEVVRSHHCRYKETSGVVRAWLHMNFYDAAPFRCKSWSRQRTQDPSPVTKRTRGARNSEIGDNAIIFSSKGPVWLIEGGYKTASKYGPNVVRFDTSKYQFVTFHLKEYKGVSRPSLLSEDTRFLLC